MNANLPLTQFMRLKSAVLKDEKDPFLQLIWIELFAHINEAGCCRVCYGTLAKNVGCGLSTAKEKIALMKEKGLLLHQQVNHEDGGQGANLYLLLQPPGYRNEEQQANAKALREACQKPHNMTHNKPYFTLPLAQTLSQAKPSGAKKKDAPPKDTLPDDDEVPFGDAPSNDAPAKAAEAPKAEEAPKAAKAASAKRVTAAMALANRFLCQLFDVATPPRDLGPKEIAYAESLIAEHGEEKATFLVECCWKRMNKDWRDKAATFCAIKPLYASVLVKDAHKFVATNPARDAIWDDLQRQCARLSQLPETAQKAPLLDDFMDFFLSAYNSKMTMAEIERRLNHFRPLIEAAGRPLVGE